MNRHAFGATSLLAVAAMTATCAPAPNTPEPTATRAQLLDPNTCKPCHQEQFREWSGSMHAYAAEDPVFLAMNARGQRETKGQLGSFCVGCHAPMAVREGATSDGLNLAEVSPSLRGVTCFFCHSVESVEGTHNNPLELAKDLALRGGLDNPAPNSAHRSAYSPLHDRDRAESSSLCGACHDIVTNRGAHIERTFLEWKESVFAQSAGATCGQCHMDQAASPVPAAQAPGAPNRRPKSHAFPAVDVAITPFAGRDEQLRLVKQLLDTTLQTALCVGDLGTATTIRVLADNVAAGHSFPSGSAQDRRLWAEVVAYQGDRVLYESGRVDPATPITASRDADLWLVRDCIFDSAGNKLHMFWDAASFEGNLFPGQATFDRLDRRFYQHFVQSFPRAGTFDGKPDRVTLRMRLQPIGLDVLDDLIATGDLDPRFRSEMPIFDIGEPAVLEWTAAAATETYLEDRLPLRCVSNTALAVRADKVPALSRARCSP